VILTSTLNLEGKLRSNLTLIDKPMRVAMLQCGIVGVNSIITLLALSSTSTLVSSTTFNSSSVSGCSGSLISRIRSGLS
jgi:uncharacterized membrane protein YjjB (DUF3815 family)